MARYRRRLLFAALILAAVAGTGVSGAAAAGASGWQVLGAVNGQPAFFHPAGLAVGKRGNLFVIDSGNFRVVKLSAGGSVIETFGSRGSGAGQFGQDALGRGPESAALDGAGNLYVADSGNRRVETFSPAGTYRAGWAMPQNGYTIEQIAVASGPQDTIYVALAVGVPCAGPCPTYYIVQRRSTSGAILSQWQSQTPPPTPTDPNISPFDVMTHISIAVGPKGTVYVGTSGGLACYKSCGDVWTIEKRSPDGRLLQSRPGSSFYGSKVVPAALAVNGQGDLFIADRGDNRSVVKRSPAGRDVAQWSSIRWYPSGHIVPNGIAVVPGGTAYVSDLASNHVLKLSSRGKVMAAWGTGGSAAGQYWNPGALAVDGRGNLYVDDIGNRRVQKLSPSGAVLLRFPVQGIGPAIAVDAQGNIYVSRQVNFRSYILRYSPSGRLTARWSVAYLGDQPTGLSVDSQGNVYMLATMLFPLSTGLPSGAYLVVLGPNGKQRGRFPLTMRFTRSNLAMTAQGQMYAVDVISQTVVRLSPSGQATPGWPLSPPSGVTDGHVAGIAVDRQGNVYVTDGLHDSLREFSSQGAPLAQWGDSGSLPGQFHGPVGVAVGSRGTLYASDAGNARLQKLARG